MYILKTCLSAFAAGFIIPLICFNILPPTFEGYGFYTGILGLLFGVMCAIFIENKIKNNILLLICNLALSGLAVLLAEKLAIFLAFSAGIIIYMCCGAIMPESNNKSLMAKIVASIGFIVWLKLISI